MTNDWTIVIAVATSITAIIGVVTLLLMERQRRMNQGNPLYLFPTSKVKLLSLVESDCMGEPGEELKAGMPLIVRYARDVSVKDWTNAVDTLVSYRLAEVSDGYLKVTEAGKRYAWKKYPGDVRAILLQVGDRKNL